MSWGHIEFEMPISVWHKEAKDEAGVFCLREWANTGFFSQVGADLSRQNQEMIWGHGEFEKPISIRAD